MAQVQLRKSTAYHPQSDGQTERVNQCIETFLRCFVSAYPKQWMKWLSLAEYWYNNSYHTAIKRSPFEAIYGSSPSSFGMYLPQDTLPGGLEEWLQERQLMSSLIKQHLLRAANRMKLQADKNRIERRFSVGDWVFLKL
jgi:hypothetical protein